MNSSDTSVNSSSNPPVVNGQFRAESSPPPSSLQLNQDPASNIALDTLPQTQTEPTKKIGKTEQIRISVGNFKAGASKLINNFVLIISRKINALINLKIFSKPMSSAQRNEAESSFPLDLNNVINKADYIKNLNDELSSEKAVQQNDLEVFNEGFNSKLIALSFDDRVEEINTLKSDLVALQKLKLDPEFKSQMHKIEYEIKEKIESVSDSFVNAGKEAQKESKSLKNNMISGLNNYLEKIKDPQLIKEIKSKLRETKVAANAEIIFSRPLKVKSNELVSKENDKLQSSETIDRIVAKTVVADRDKGRNYGRIEMYQRKEDENSVKKELTEAGYKVNNLLLKSGKINFISDNMNVTNTIKLADNPDQKILYYALYNEIEDLMREDKTVPRVDAVKYTKYISTELNVFLISLSKDKVEDVNELKNNFLTLIDNINIIKEDFNKDEFRETFMTLFVDDIYKTRQDIQKLKSAYANGTWPDGETREIVTQNISTQHFESVKKAVINVFEMDSFKNVLQKIYTQ